MSNSNIVDTNNADTSLQMEGAHLPIGMEGQQLKILVIQQKMIGDVLISTVICEALKKKYPSATIHYLVHSNTIPVIQENPFIDHIIEFKQEYRDNKKAFYRFLKLIRNTKYDSVIDAYGKIESNLITLFSGARTKISFYKWYTYYLYSTTIRNKSYRKTTAGIAIENRLRLIYPEDQITTQNIFRPKIFLTTQEKQQASDFLINKGISQYKPLIMINVLGSEKRKTLPAKTMASIIDEIVSITKATILFNYIPFQAKDAKEIFELTTAETKKSIRFDVFGNSLREFLAILAHCDALIGNEGGATNMAKALNKPTFTIFSPWIMKEAWDMFDDGIINESIHLKDFKPELYHQKSLKEMKEKVVFLYEQFSAKLILSKLKPYLKGLNF